VLPKQERGSVRPAPAAVRAAGGRGGDRRERTIGLTFTCGAGGRRRFHVTAGNRARPLGLLHRAGLTILRQLGHRGQPRASYDLTVHGQRLSCAPSRLGGDSGAEVTARHEAATGQIALTSPTPATGTVRFTVRQRLRRRSTTYS